MLLAARQQKGWTQEQAAEAATGALREAATQEDASTQEKAVWLNIEISRHSIAGLENSPTNPIATIERRACLLGLALALGLDRSKLNRLAGGL